MTQLGMDSVSSICINENINYEMIRLMVTVDRSMSQCYLNAFMEHAISKKQADDPA